MNPRLDSTRAQALSPVIHSQLFERGDPRFQFVLLAGLLRHRFDGLEFLALTTSRSLRMRSAWRASRPRSFLTPSAAPTASVSSLPTRRKAARWSCVISAISPKMWPTGIWPKSQSSHTWRDCHRPDYCVTRMLGANNLDASYTTPAKRRVCLTVTGGRKRVATIISRGKCRS